MLDATIEQWKSIDVLGPFSLCSVASLNGFLFAWWLTTHLHIHDVLLLKKLITPFPAEQEIQSSAADPKVDGSSSAVAVAFNLGKMVETRVLLCPCTLRSARWPQFSKPSTVASLVILSWLLLWNFIHYCDYDRHSPSTLNTFFHAYAKCKAHLNTKQ